MVSEFYERKRRLAYLFAVLSVGILAVQLYLGALLGVFSHPRIASDVDRVYVLHRSASQEESESGSRLIFLDASLEPARAPYRLSGHAGGLAPDPEGLVLYFGTRYSVIRDGNTIRNGDLQKKWEVRDAVYDPATGRAWIFGWADGKILYRTRILGNYSDDVAVAASDLLEPVESVMRSMSASIEPGTGPLVAWREQGSAKIRTALWNGTAFAPSAEFDIGAAEHWDVFLHQGRIVLLYFHRDDRSFQRLTLRLRCCAGCGRPALPETVSFAEPILLIGRKVTGLAAEVVGDRLLVALTRAMTAQYASVLLSDFRPTPETATLRALGSEPLWRYVVAALAPLMMLFFSFSLVFLGFTLLRERGRFVLEKASPVRREGVVVAEILQRAMAYILDLIVIFPVFYVAVELLNVSPESSALDLADPRFRAMLGVWFALRFAYHFLLEWTTGRTLGKRIIGIRVVRADGSRLGFWGALVRNLVRLIDADFPHIGVFLGAAVMAVTPRRQRLGDLLARTIVVQDLGRPAGPG